MRLTRNTYSLGVSNFFQAQVKTPGECCKVTLSRRATDIQGFISAKHCFDLAFGGQTILIRPQPAAGPTICPHLYRPMTAPRCGRWWGCSGARQAHHRPFGDQSRSRPNDNPARHPRSARKVSPAAPHALSVRGRLPRRPVDVLDSPAVGTLAHDHGLDRKTRGRAVSRLTDRSPLAQDPGNVSGYPAYPP